MHEAREVFKTPKPLTAQTPVPEGFTCLEIIIPDDLEWVYIVQGLLAQLCLAFNWQGEPDEREARANLMVQAYSETDWEGCMTCADVADCIENDAAVQAALNAVYNPAAPAAPIPASLAAGNLLPVIADCDEDELFGAIVNLIDNMNVNNLDAQQLLAGLANVGERVEKFIAALPGIGILPLDEIIGYVNGLWSDDAFTAYAAADTTAYRNELKCDLLCIAESNGCSLSLDDLGEYFSNRLGSAWQDTLSDVLLYLVAGVWTGTEINDTFYLAQALFLAHTNNFFAKLGLLPFETYLATGEPDNNWAALCDDCPNIDLVETYPGVITNNPQFVSNTATGSIWSATYHNAGGGSFDVALTPRIAGEAVCCVLIDATPVTSYQHEECGAGIVTGSGDGASPPNYSLLGFIHNASGTITIELEPVP